MVEGGSLENCCAARYRGFESYFLRHFYCGCRQVVRHKLPKLIFAGSIPVTRSKISRKLFGHFAGDEFGEEFDDALFPELDEGLVAVCLFSLVLKFRMVFIKDRAAN